MGLLILAAFVCAGAIVLYQQFRFHLPYRYSVVYGLAYFSILGVAFYNFQNIVDFKIVIGLGLVFCLACVVLIKVTRRLEKDYDQNRK